MKKLAALLIVFAALFGCSKPYASKIDLAVDSERLLLPSSAEGYFYMHIASNRDWTLSIESDKDWPHPEQTSGSGTAYPKFHYDAYSGAVAREARIVISCDVKTLTVTVVQPQSE